MNILAKCVYGSRLYGTNIPSSDYDWRYIHLPSLEDCVLDRITNAINIKGEDSLQDNSSFSLHYFMEMAATGQGIAIELLCAPESCVEINSDIFRYLRENRKLFFTKQMGSLLKYSRNMVSKYSVRLDRMRETEKALEIINQHGDYQKLWEIWDLLPIGEFLEKTINERNSSTDKRVYSVCGRQIQATVPLNIASDILTKLKDGYGARVRAADSQDFDFKAVMHSFRAIYQVRQILETGDLQFPLEQTPWLIEVRLGKYHFVNDGLQDKLDSLLIETEQLVEKSNLPDKVNKDFVDNFILNAYGIKS